MSSHFSSQTSSPAPAGARTFCRRALLQHGSSDITLTLSTTIRCVIYACTVVVIAIFLACIFIICTHRRESRRWHQPGPGRETTYPPKATTASCFSDNGTKMSSHFSSQTSSPAPAGARTFCRRALLQHGSSDITLTLSTTIRCVIYACTVVVIAIFLACIFIICTHRRESRRWHQPGPGRETTYPPKATTTS